MYKNFQSKPTRPESCREIKSSDRINAVFRQFCSWTLKTVEFMMLLYTIGKSKLHGRSDQKKKKMLFLNLSLIKRTFESKIYVCVCVCRNITIVTIYYIRYRQKCEKTKYRKHHKVNDSTILLNYFLGCSST